MGNFFSCCKKTTTEKAELTKEEQNDYQSIGPTEPRKRRLSESTNIGTARLSSSAPLPGSRSASDPINTSRVTSSTSPMPESLIGKKTDQFYLSKVTHHIARLLHYGHTPKFSSTSFLKADEKNLAWQLLIELAEVLTDRYPKIGQSDFNVLVIRNLFAQQEESFNNQQHKNFEIDKKKEETELATQVFDFCVKYRNILLDKATDRINHVQTKIEDKTLITMLYESLQIIHNQYSPSKPAAPVRANTSPALPVNNGASSSGETSGSEKAHAARSLTFGSN